MQKFYLILSVLLFFSCSKEDYPLGRNEVEPDSNKTSSDCFMEDEYGNCIDGGPPINLPEIIIVPPGAGGGTGINDLWLEMLTSMSTFPNSTDGGLQVVLI